MSKLFSPKMKIPLVDLSSNYLSIKEEIDQAISKILHSSTFILGKPVEEFEENFANFCQAKYCVGLDSGISALELGLLALGVGPGDEVITPAFSFIASSSAISFTGAKPVWVDVDLKTGNILVNAIEKKITKKTKAIMPVHLYGQPADLEAILKIAKKHKLFVVEDACQAHGATYANKKVGTWGDIAAFSFYPGKNLGAYGDAGALITNSLEIATKVKQMRNYGQDKKYNHVFLAWNRRLDSLQAAILNVKLKYLELWNNKRIQAALTYNSLLKNLPIKLPVANANREHVYHLYVIQTNLRDGLLEFLNENDIQAGVHYPTSIHKQPAYKHLGDQTFKNSEKLSKSVLSLPIYPEITNEQIKYVAKKIKEFHALGK